MIQTRSMAEALQRGLYGLGDIGQTMSQVDKAKQDAALQAAQQAGVEANTAGTALDNKTKSLTFESALKHKQLLDALQGAAPSPSIGTTAAQSALQSPDNSPTPGLGSPSAGSSQGMPDDHANLVAKLLQGDGNYDATPEMVKAKHQATLTQTQNTGTLSNQAVTAGQQQIDTGAIGLDTARQTQGADIQTKNMAPLAEKAKIGQSSAAAAKDWADADKIKNAKDKPDPEVTIRVEQNLRQQFLNQAKPFEAIRDAYSKINASQDNAAGDMSMIFGYMKILDPGSTVREGEAASAQEAAGVPTRILNAYNNALQGTRLAPDQRKQFKTQAEALYGTQKAVYEQSVKAFSDIAKGYGADPSRVTVDLMTPKPAAPSASGAPKAGEVDSGYRFKGGDPADRNNWEKAL